jgi:SAM-dependent methyltransferase
VSFAVPAESYDDFMGRYSRKLAPRLIAFAGVEPGMKVLDVGCGPGALTEALAARIGPEDVAAADPSPPFVSAARDRIPGADVREVPAESLPWPDETFDAVLSQLVVNFMDDAHAGVGEMRRVTRPGGTVASCTWDYSEEMRMLRVFWDAATALDPDAPDEATMRFRQPGELSGLWEAVGLADVETGPLEVEVEYAGFDQYWLPFTAGIGPAGSYCASLDPDRQAALREECRARLGDPRGPFSLSARAWAVRGRR